GRHGVLAPHSAVAHDLGLGPALRCYVNGYIERSGLAVDLEVAPDIDRLPPDTELAVFRVAQEALTNVSRHSQSPTARIRLARKKASTGQNVVLSVEDAGRGMAPIGNRRALIGGKVGWRRWGVVLASSPERRHESGGRLKTDSRLGRTVVTAIIPIAG